MLINTTSEKFAMLDNYMYKLAGGTLSVKIVKSNSDGKDIGEYIPVTRDNIADFFIVPDVFSSETAPLFSTAVHRFIEKSMKLAVRPPCNLLQLEIAVSSEPDTLDETEIYERRAEISRQIAEEISVILKTNPGESKTDLVIFLPKKDQNPDRFYYFNQDTKQAFLIAPINLSSIQELRSYFNQPLRAIISASDDCLSVITILSPVYFGKYQKLQKEIDQANISHLAFAKKIIDLSPLSLLLESDNQGQSILQYIINYKKTELLKILIEKFGFYVNDLFDNFTIVRVIENCDVDASDLLDESARDISFYAALEQKIQEINRVEEQYAQTIRSLKLQLQSYRLDAKSWRDAIEGIETQINDLETCKINCGTKRAKLDGYLELIKPYKSFFQKKDLTTVSYQLPEKLTQLVKKVENQSKNAKIRKLITVFTSAIRACEYKFNAKCYQIEHHLDGELQFFRACRPPLLNLMSSLEEMSLAPSKKGLFSLFSKPEESILKQLELILKELDKKFSIAFEQEKQSVLSELGGLQYGSRDNATVKR